MQTGRTWPMATNRPTEALPHEHEALKLLKGIQESSRIYVQKVGFEAAALRPEEDRLTGDLSEIADVRASRQGSNALPAAEISVVAASCGPDAGVLGAARLAHDLGAQ